MAADVRAGKASENALIRYLKDVKAELKKITWPTKETILKSTGTVLFYMVLFALVLSLYDSVFNRLLNFILTKF